MGINDERDDLVPYFRSNKGQIIFEFIYLIFLLTICVALAIGLHLHILDVPDRTKLLSMAALGGVLGGWTFDAKWFYMVTAKGKDNEKKWSWEYHKFYWRILTPFVSGILSFALYLLGNSGVVKISIGDGESSSAAFSFCFIMGYFSDNLMSKLSKIAVNVSGEKDAK